MNCGASPAEPARVITAGSVVPGIPSSRYPAGSASRQMTASVGAMEVRAVPRCARRSGSPPYSPHHKMRSGSCRRNPADHRGGFWPTLTPSARCTCSSRESRTKAMSCSRETVGRRPCPHADETKTDRSGYWARVRDLRHERLNRHAEHTDCRAITGCVIAAFPVSNAVSPPYADRQHPVLELAWLQAPGHGHSSSCTTGTPVSPPRSTPPFRPLASG
jgi:hypothetical protein